MTNEATKTKALLTENELAVLKGRGIDIGCGTDPVTPDAYAFDLGQGDANEITKYVNDQFDFVFSSHCLEHMVDPPKALAGWWEIVRRGGYLFLIVPDEDLYEQGVFPSRFNADHKWTFTISKNRSWSDKSINVFSLVRSLPNSEIIKLELQDNGYDRSIAFFGRIKSNVFIKRFLHLHKRLEKFGIKLKSLEEIKNMLMPVDQTCETGALAQIMVIIKKVSSPSPEEQ